MKANSWPLQVDRSMEMEAITFYGTVGAIILLQISFYWLFRDDHYKRQMTQDEIGQQRLLILLAGPSESFRAAGGASHTSVSVPTATTAAATTTRRNYEEGLLLWRRRLEQIGFIIYELHLGEQLEQWSFNQADRVIRIAAGKQDHIDRAVDLVDRELRANEQKLHAFVALPHSRPAAASPMILTRSEPAHDDGDGNHLKTNQDGGGQQQQQEYSNSNNNKLINLIRDEQLQSYQLLSALGPILNRNSRIIQVQSRAETYTASETPATTTMVHQQSNSLHDDGQAAASLSSLQSEIETLVNSYLRSQLARSNRGQLIEVVCKPTNWCCPTQKEANQRLRNGALHETENADERFISEKCADTSKLYEELQKILVLVNPRDRIELE